jgi:DNA polymerase III alpha subunit (gram-positive type)
MTRIIYWDLETTGLNPFHDQIIEIAAVDNHGNSFESLVCLEEGRALSSKVTELTGITTDTLKGQPDINDVLIAFTQFTEGADYLIGHNSIRFDSLFLKCSLRRGKLQLINVPHLDTMLLCQWLYPNIFSFALVSLCKYFSIKHEMAHRAMGDVTATRSLFEVIQKKCQKVSLKSLHEIINVH